MNAYLTGFGTGLILALATGPVFLTLLQNAISFGYKRAMFFILGVAMSDSCIILLTWLGLSQVGDQLDGPWLTIVGSFLLIVFGLIFLLRKEENKDIETQPTNTASGNIGLWIQGIMIGAINPLVWGFWATISNYSISTFDLKSDQLLYFFGVLSLVWISDIAKAYFATKLKKFLNDQVRSYLRKGIGALLILIGLSMVIKYYFID